MVASAQDQQAGTTTWQIDPAHSSVEFSVKHLMFSRVRGRFDRFGGTIVANGGDLTNHSVDVEIETASISTGDEKRDEHLRSPDFFDAQKYPTISFKSTTIEAKGDDRYLVVGDLTMHGETNQAELDMTFNGSGMSPFGMEVAGYTAETQINRTEYGLTWNAALESGGVMVGDTVKITLDIEALKQG